jgi:hypothetical protein
MTFVNTFFNEPDLKEINLLIGSKYDYQINERQFYILMTFAKTKMVVRVLLQNEFNAIMSSSQIEEISETRFKIT